MSPTVSARSRDLGPALQREATLLGVETTFTSAAGARVESDPQSVARVVDVLRADRRSDATSLLDEVIIAGGPADVRVACPDLDRFDDAELALADGTVLARRDIAGSWPTLPLGCHELAVAASGGAQARATVVVAPETMPTMTGRRSGLFTPAFGLWSNDDPLPAYHHLGDLAAALAARRVDVLFTLPLYDLFLDEPFDPSPYSPVSRLHWNEVYLDDASLPPWPLPATVHDPRVDLASLAVRRRAQLLAAASQLLPTVTDELDSFAAQRPDVVGYARFRTATAPAGDHPTALVERSHVLAQFLAHRQLSSAATRGASLGLDLPVGSHRAGYETWAHPGLFAEGFSVGAPPDPLALDGQDWGFPPQLPGAARRSGYDLWRRLVERASEHAGVVRIDHVMAVHRLWWIPPGEPSSRGVYVRYPADELLAVIAAGAAVHGTVVVGENLGTVPSEVDEAMARWEMLGMYEEGFHLDDGTLPVVPARSVAGIRTHDMPAFATAIGAVEAPAHRAAMPPGRRWDDPGDAVELVLERLAASDAALVVADLDDLTGGTEPHNEPGRPGPSTWRRRLAAPFDKVLAGGDVERRLGMITTRRATEATR